jgi:hypothetical protein
VGTASSTRLLASFLFDLERRCELVKQRLSGLPDNEDTQHYVRAAYTEIETTRRQSATLREDPTLGREAFQRNQFAHYRRLKQSLLILESFALPFVERFDETDRRLTRLCRRLIEQVRWPLPPPLMTAFSSQGYWVPAAADLISAPATETMSLLGLPDMCHELGHLLWRHHSGALTGDFVNEVRDYIRSQIHRVQVEQRPPERKADFEKVSVLWQGKWLQEFVADMVAVYLTGPAFGRQNVLICAETDRNVFTPGLGEVSTHPADAARHAGVLAVLRLLHDEEGAERVGRDWDEYLALSGDTDQKQYAGCYPDHLIDSLAAKVVSGCQILKIRPFTDAPTGTGSETDVVASIREAWDRLLHDPATYRAWEQERLAFLSAHL